MYDANSLNLYDIIEDYHDADEEQKGQIFRSFCSSIWSCGNNRRVYEKYIKFEVLDELKETDLGKIFDEYSLMPFKYHKSKTSEKDWKNLIKQKINNLYSYYCDKNVIVADEYMELLKYPRTLYYDWLENDETYDQDDLKRILDEKIEEIKKTNEKLKKRKLEIKWNDFKKISEKFLLEIFNTSKIKDEFNSDKLDSYFSNVHEDNMYIRYFCKSLDGKMRDYQKRYYGVRLSKKYRYCDVCGHLYEIKKKDYSSKYCPTCKVEVRKKQNRKAYEKWKLSNAKSAKN